MCSVATILDELTDTTKKTTCLISLSQTTKTIAATPNALLRITKQLLLEVSTRSFLGTQTTLLNIERVTRNAFFLG